MTEDQKANIQILTETINNTPELGKMVYKNPTTGNCCIIGLMAKQTSEAIFADLTNSQNNEKRIIFFDTTPITEKFGISNDGLISLQLFNDDGCYYDEQIRKQQMIDKLTTYM